MKRHVFVGMMSLGAVVLAAGCGEEIVGVATERFTATLNGANERPDPRTTPGAGTANFTLRRDTLSWTVTMTSMTNVTGGHIHIGGPTVSGGVLLPLTGAPGSFSNSLITGRVTRSTFVAPGAPNQAVTFDSLLVLMRTNGSYVNIHTNNGTGNPNEGPGDFPAGEIRGQVVKVN